MTPAEIIRFSRAVENDADAIKYAKEAGTPQETRLWVLADCALRLHQLKSVDNDVRVWATKPVEANMLRALRVIYGKGVR